MKNCAIATALQKRRGGAVSTSPRPRDLLAMCVTRTGKFDILLVVFENRLRQHWGEITCYDSCQFCDPFNSCDFSSCYDDTVFTETLLDKVSFVSVASHTFLNSRVHWILRMKRR